MEAPISASQGAMRSLPGKLASLLLEPPGHGLTKGEKTKIRLLKGDLEELIANYLMEPSEVDAPALTANCWVKEVRELSYDIDDFVKEFSVAQKTPRVKITRLRENLNRRRWIADEISGFRNRVKEAIKLHRNYNLGSCSFRPWRNSDEHPLPPLYGVGTARLVHRDDLWDKLHGWLTDDGEQQQRVASIVGIGGVGKTALAKQVYEKLGGRFECRAFVRTSRKADMRRLLTSMLSQLRRHEPPEADAWEVHHLIDKVREHLKHKKYFIIIDDLWSTSTWDIVSRALPDNPCSGILLTTEFDIVAQMCCGYNSKYIFKMEPLSEDGSRELFFSRAFGHQHDCPEQLNEVSYEIIRKCGGLPLATITIASLLASQPNRIDQWKYIQNSLSSILKTDPTLEGMQQVLNIIYNNLPHHLKACMLYLSMYQESHIIWKHDLVKQWTAEDFISVVEGEDMEEIAGSYFDELVKRGMIQPVDINYNGEVLSCAVHYIVLNFIRYKSIEENFVCAIDHSQTNVRLTNKVRRLSLHFGDAEDVKPPSLRLSQVRSVGFFGLFKCMPSILEFNLLQVLIHQLWADDCDMSCNFTEISKLFRLRYLRINAFHLSVQLPTQMQRLKDLVTLEIESRVTVVPSDIVDLPRLLHLSLPSETALPNGIGRMTSLRTLGYFNLSSNSKENVLNLGELTNLCDLRLTCSTVPSDNLEDNMQCLSTILWKLSRLKSLTLAPEFSHTKTPVASVSSMSISCDGLGSVSSPPTLLQRLELLPRICIFSSLPEWIRKLDRLSILSIAVRGLSMNDIDILKGLLALTALSLYVRTAPVERIVFDKAGFPILKYFKFMCTAPCLAFEEGAMPNVRRLKLGSNAHRAEQYGPVLSSIKYLLSLEEITVLICGSDRTAAKPVLWDAITKHPSTPVVNVQYVDWIFYCEEEKIRATQEEEQPSLENQYENVEVDSDRQHGILEMNTGKGTAQEQEQPSLENQYENVEVDSDRQHGILEMNTGKDTNNQADCRISMSPESSSHLPSPGHTFEGAEIRFEDQKPLTEQGQDGNRWFKRFSKPLAKLQRSIVDAYKSLKTTSQQKPEGAEKARAKGMKKELSVPKDASGNVISAQTFTFRQLAAATRNFSEECFIAEGGFGRVYKGHLDGTGQVVAIKQLNRDGNQGNREFLAEVHMRSLLHHQNLVNFVGYCADGDQRLLVYEYMPLGSLEDHLHDLPPDKEPLDWNTRMKIAAGAAKGLEYLHDKAQPPVIHGDFKSANILLGKDFHPKLSDFGLAKLGPVGDKSYVSTPVMGTYGYCAPEYAMTGQLTVKSDVYSFGVVLLELITGRKAIDSTKPHGEQDLVSWARPLFNDGRMHPKMVDPGLEGRFPARGFYQALAAAQMCTQSEAASRPLIADVVKIVANATYSTYSAF